jgi:hypothetical protein
MTLLLSVADIPLRLLILTKLSSSEGQMWQKEITFTSFEKDFLWLVSEFFAKAIEHFNTYTAEQISGSESRKSRVQEN